MNSKVGASGFSVLGLLVAVTIVAVAFVIASSSVSLNRKNAAVLDDTALAESYAVELLELLRAHNSAQLSNYLLRNPFNPPNNPPGTCVGCSTTCAEVACATCLQCTPYSFCAHINILDRSTTPPKIANEDPLAALPANNPLDGITPQTKANRFYQVQIVDAATLIPDDTVCTKNPKQILPTATQRYLITTGVSWVPVGKTSNEPQRIVLSTVIP